MNYLQLVEYKEILEDNAKIIEKISMRFYNNSEIYCDLYMKRKRILNQIKRINKVIENFQ